MIAALLLTAEAGGEKFNPILPETNEIIYGGLAFLVLFVVLSKVAMPAIRASLKAREDRVRDDLAAAESAKTEAQRVLDDYRRQLADARNEADRIIDESRRAADGVRKELMAKAESEAAELLARAQTDIEATVAKVRADLQHRVADLAITLAEKVIERNLDRQAQLDLVNRYIEQVGALPAGSRS
jgi:F-type H+-transporting ATPase subunit b